MTKLNPETIQNPFLRNRPSTSKLGKLTGAVKKILPQKSNINIPLLRRPCTSEVPTLSGPSAAKDDNYLKPPTPYGNPKRSPSNFDNTTELCRPSTSKPPVVKAKVDTNIKKRVMGKVGIIPITKKPKKVSSKTVKSIPLIHVDPKKPDQRPTTAAPPKRNTWNTITTACLSDTAYRKF